MFNLPQRRKKAPDKPLKEYAKRGVSWSGITPPDTLREALVGGISSLQGALFGYDRVVQEPRWLRQLIFTTPSGQRFRYCWAL